MARIPPVTRESVPEDLRSVFDEVSSGPGGVGTGPMSIIKHSPELSRRAIPLFEYVRNESSLPQTVRELAMLTTARAKDCPYIWNAHAALGRKAGPERCPGGRPARPAAAAFAVRRRGSSNQPGHGVFWLQPGERSDFLIWPWTSSAPRAWWS